MKYFYSHRDEPGRGGTSYLFINDYKMQQVTDPFQADVVIWNGGEDIGTSIYGEKSMGANVPYKPSQRDTEEIELFNLLEGKPGKLLFGICRGAQLLNCLNGGKLYQDINNHTGSHDMYDCTTGEILRVTSTHHQQMRASPEATIIGVSNRSTYKWGATVHMPLPVINRGDDMEILWYPRSHSLCVQGHPEYVPGSRFASYTLELLTKCWLAIQDGQSTSCEVA